VIETERLVLRGWREADAILHHAMCADPAVTRYLGPPPSLADSRDVVARQRHLLDTNGYCFWVVERQADAAFLGWCGLKPGAEGTPIADLPEIGWSLLPAAWGQGYALEAARGTLAWAWAATAWARIYAMTVPANTASWGLMQRLGMARIEGGDFNHPALAEDDPLRLHILYRIDRP
jgi:RimJ/RimL family protein N-acetyltransferase